MPRLTTFSVLTMLLTAACGTPGVLEQPVAVPRMAVRTETPLPVLAEAKAAAPAGQMASVPATPAAQPLPAESATDWDPVLAAPAATLGKQLTRTASGWSGPGGAAASQMGDLTFFADGSWMRRNGESYQHSDGGVTVKRGGTFFHSDGTWSRRVGDEVKRSDGHSCTITGAVMVCR